MLVWEAWIIIFYEDVVHEEFQNFPPWKENFRNYWACVWLIPVYNGVVFDSSWHVIDISYHSLDP